MSGACNGAADMYQSFPGQQPGWYPTCGTSEATPEFAGIVALADQVAGHPLGLINPALYRLLAAAPELREHHIPLGIVDVTRGGNTVSFRQDGRLRTVTGFRARPGYDLASGTGTVNARYFVPQLVAVADHPGWSGARLAAALAALTRRPAPSDRPAYPIRPARPGHPSQPGRCAWCGRGALLRRQPTPRPPGRPGWLAGAVLSA